MSYVTEVHDRLSADMVAISTYLQLAWFTELPPEARTVFLCGFASAGSKGHFQIGFSNFVAKGFYDILHSIHERMEKDEWINLEDEKVELKKQISLAREKNKKFKEDIAELTKNLADKYKSIVGDSEPMNPEEEERVKSILKEKFKNQIISDGGLMLLDDNELTEKDIKDIRKVLGDKIKFIGKISLNDDGSIDKSSLQF